MKTLTYLFSFMLIGLISINSSFAQKDYSARLKKEIVKIDAGKYVSNDYQYLKFSNGNTMQIKVSASCPVEVMTRDNFINIYSTVSTMMLLATFAEAGVEIPDMKELDELIGDPDITYNIVMAKNGMQIQVITSQGKENVTMKWDDLFED
ncbi:MAG: hypothetical protein WBJ48_07055 [Bacteroidales bacterium]|nr:hypothetical protein [Bacteroidales bacterium]